MPNHNLTKLLYTVIEASDVLSIGRTRIYQMMNSGEIPSVKVGSSRLISADALAAYAESLTSDAPSDHSKPWTSDAIDFDQVEHIVEEAAGAIDWPISRVAFIDAVYVIIGRIREAEKQ